MILSATLPKKTSHEAATIKDKKKRRSSVLSAFQNQEKGKQFPIFVEHNGTKMEIQVDDLVKIRTVLSTMSHFDQIKEDEFTVTYHDAELNLNSMISDYNIVEGAGKNRTICCIYTH